MTDHDWWRFAFFWLLILLGCGLGHQLWKINRTLGRIAARTEELARIVAYHLLATSEQRANHVHEYQASLDRIRDFFESDAGHEIARIIMGQPKERPERGSKGNDEG